MNFKDALVPEFIVLKKIQWMPYARYLPPLPSPDSYTGEWFDDNGSLDSEDCQHIPIPSWCKNDCDSYDTSLPKKVLLKEASNIQGARRIHQEIEIQPKEIRDSSWPPRWIHYPHPWTFQCWYNKKGQKELALFVKRNQICHNTLEKLLWKWCSLSRDEREWGLIPLWVQDLSHNQ